MSNLCGIGILKLVGAVQTAPMLAANGTLFGGWFLDTSNNNFGEAADYDGGGHAELLVSSPWGLGILKWAGATTTAPMMQPTGTRFGGWLLGADVNQFGPGCRLRRRRQGRTAGHQPAWRTTN